MTILSFRAVVSLIGLTCFVECALAAPSVTPLASSTFVEGSHEPPGAVVTYTGSGFNWGDDSTAGTTASYFEYDYLQPPVGPITIPPGGIDVGEFQYWNGSSLDVGAPDSVKFRLDVSIDGGSTTAFYFSMGMVNTLNTAVDPRDSVIATPIPTLGAAYNASIDFVLSTDLEPGTALGNTLTVDELAGASARLILTLTPNNGTPSVPDSGSTLALLGSGIAALGILRRRR